MASEKVLRGGFAELAIHSAVRHLNKEKVRSAQRGMFRKSNTVTEMFDFARLDDIKSRPVFRAEMDKKGRRCAVSEVNENERKILTYSATMMKYYQGKILDMFFTSER